MKIVADTNIFLAVALNEPEKKEIIALTVGHELIAPEILPFEIGNALSALVKRKRLWLQMSVGHVKSACYEASRAILYQYARPFPLSCNARP